MKVDLKTLGGLLAIASVLVGLAMGWQRLVDRVEQLERRERFEHGSYQLPKE